MGRRAPTSLSDKSGCKLPMLYWWSGAGMEEFWWSGSGKKAPEYLLSYTSNTPIVTWGV